ncbi:prepilin-type N-terminal cleavage/methylation domain-containing protein [candidate division WOR-3 bacterium]|nr:prepilin-type N-terminal cleavage/methylation domain-containing protein [candidate division WOR-3 bacterium]
MGETKGFTLIELMVVIIIIGVLSAIGIANYIKMTEKARVASLMANMHTVQIEVELFGTDSLVYPSDAAQIISILPQNVYNPYNKSLPALQNRADEDIPGVVEYYVYSSRSLYQITGFNKDTEAIDLTLTPSRALF